MSKTKTLKLHLMIGFVALGPAFRSAFAEIPEFPSSGPDHDSTSVIYDTNCYFGKFSGDCFYFDEDLTPFQIEFKTQHPITGVTAIKSGGYCVSTVENTRCEGFDQPTNPVRSLMSLTAGESHVCGVTLNRKSLYCWGSNSDLPERYYRFSDEITRYVNGRNHICLEFDGNIQCLGNNDYGQIDVPDLDTLPIEEVGMMQAEMRDYGCLYGKIKDRSSEYGNVCWGRSDAFTEFVQRDSRGPGGVGAQRGNFFSGRNNTWYKVRTGRGEFHGYDIEYLSWRWRDTMHGRWFTTYKHTCTGDGFGGSSRCAHSVGHSGKYLLKNLPARNIRDRKRISANFEGDGLYPEKKRFLEFLLNGESVGSFSFGASQPFLLLAFLSRLQGNPEVDSMMPRFNEYRENLVSRYPIESVAQIPLFRDFFTRNGRVPQIEYDEVLLRFILKSIVALFEATRGFVDVSARTAMEEFTVKIGLILSDESISLVDVQSVLEDLQLSSPVLTAHSAQRLLPFKDFLEELFKYKASLDRLIADGGAS